MINLLAFILVVQLNDSLLIQLSTKSFKTSFTEIINYKSFTGADTFKGVLSKSGEKIVMEITSPSRERYTIRGDTFFVKNQQGENFYLLEQDAIKLLNFEFLADTLSYEIKKEDYSYKLTPKDESWFNFSKLKFKNGKPHILEIDDEEKNIRFFFYNWKYSE